MVSDVPATQGGDDRPAPSSRDRHTGARRVRSTSS